MPQLRNFIVCCFALLFTGSFYASAQTANYYTVNGVVQDSTGMTIPGATVFLGSTKKITVSDNSGNFQLNGINNGTYQVGVKMMGYEPFSQNIVVNGDHLHLKVLLKISAHALGQVVISAKNNDKEYLRTFIAHFIGGSENAASCEIINPQVLHFHYDKKQLVLTAFADSVLIVENRALGYRVRYMLQKFQYNYTTKTTFYSGLPYFEEITANAQQTKRFAANRATTYASSIMRFFRAVANNDLAKNDFAVYQFNDNTILDHDGFPTVIDSLWTIKRLGNGIVSIKPKTTILAQYKRGLEAMSKIVPETGSALIDINGGYTNDSFLFSGYWSAKGVADMLPLDYQPTPANNYHLTGNNPAQRLIAAIDSFNTVVPKEKIFIQTDRPAYNNTDTVWLKAYILDATLNYSKQSGLLYTELINDTGKVVLRQSMPVRMGISFGQVILDDKTTSEGSYTLRAYTNWMQNQGPASFFTQKLYIGSASNNEWLVNETHHLEKNAGADNIHVAMQLTRPNKDKVRLQDLRLKVMNGENVLQHDNVTTDMDGKLDLNLNLPTSKTNDLRFVIETAKKDSTHRLIVPLSINRPQNIDLQFMPEGGMLVTGLPSHVGFKAIGEDGRGIDVAGNVVDQQGNIAATFQSGHLGMGSFIFMPQESKTYTAKLTTPAGNTVSYPVGSNAHQGLVMHVSDPAERDSVYVTVYASSEMTKDTSYMLIGIAGGKVLYAANLSMQDGVAHGIIDKDRFPDGITHFVVFNAQKQPLAERLVFIDHHNALNISISPDKKAYQLKDSVALHIRVTGKEDRPVQGSFSLAVTDDDLVNAASSATDIRTSMLLSSDLKGEIEDPAYYFNTKNADRHDALDDLLLTQGWVGYDWKNVFDHSYKPAFRAEPSISVTGHISRAGGKAVGGLQVVLFSPKKPAVMLDQITDANGKFAFRNLPRVDTGNFLLQVKDKKGKMFEANINVDEFQAPVTAGIDNSPVTPWYVNTDTTLLNYMKSSLKYNKLAYDLKFPLGSKVLKEVKINARKTVKGSHFYAGAGAVPDVVLDEADMRKANKMPIEELLMHKIKGFTWVPYPCDGFPSSLEYTVGCNPIVFFIDGFPVDEFYVPHPGYTDHYEYIKDFIGVFTAEDVRGIEEKDEKNYSIIEITTWSGNGAFMKRTHGRYLYRPMPIIWPKQFYQPRYTAKNDNTLADLRATVLWEPNIITDTAGKATVWFYAKGKPANYTGVINGADMNGSVGSAIFKIKTK